MQDSTRRYQESGNHGGVMRALFAVLIYGSLWGILEATAGAVLHLFMFPYAGAVMANVGFFVMAAAASSTVRPKYLPLMGLVAALFKVMDAFILAVPLWERMIVNPAVAIILESLAFTLVLGLLGKPVIGAGRFGSPFRPSRTASNLAGFAVGGAAAMILGQAATALVFFLVFKRGPWKVATLTELGRFIAARGGAAVLLSLAVCPAGALVGRALPVILALGAGASLPEGSPPSGRALFSAGPPDSRPRVRGLLVRYVCATLVVAACWAAAAWLRVSGIAG